MINTAFKFTQMETQTFWSEKYLLLKLQIHTNSKESKIEYNMKIQDTHWSCFFFQF